MTDSLHPEATAMAAPPHPLDALWRVRLGDTEYGPVSGVVVRGWLTEGRVDAGSLVNAGDGEDGWGPLNADPILAALVRPRGSAVALREAGSRDLAPVAAETQGVTVNIVQHFSATSAPRGEYDAGPRNPLFALILSLLLPGAGQFYNGRSGRACACLAITVVLWLVWLGWLMNLLAAAEAYLDAKTLTMKYHRQHGDLGLGVR